MEYRVDIIEDFQSLSNIEVEWNRLYSLYSRGNIFLSFTWISSWCEYNCEIKPFIIIVRDSHNNISGIAPLGISCQIRYYLKTHILSFLADGPSDYQDFLILQDNEVIVNEIIRTIMINKKKWDVVELNEFPYNSVNKQLILANKIANFRSRICSVLPRIEFIENDVQVESIISNATKRDIIYQLRRLKKSGSVELGIISNVSQITDFMNSFYELHKKRWNQTKTKSCFNSVTFQLFITSLAIKMFNQGHAAFYYLNYNGKTVACHFGFKSNNTFFYYIPAYDPDFGKYSIGKVFLYLLIKSEANNNLQRFDFLRGDDNYKNQWDVSVYKNIQITSVKNNLKGLFTMFYLIYNNNRKFFLFRVYRKFIKWLRLKH